MKKTLKKISTAAFSIVLFSGSLLSATAQKLPGVQEASVTAPANIKVDGKLLEWNDTFQALNKTTNVYYTVSNDDNNLYLVMKSVDQSNNNKIIGGGINLTINTSGKKSEKDAFTLIFPVVNPVNLRNTMMQGMRAGGNAGGPPDSAAIEGMRRKAISTFKEVKLVGFKNIPDSVISIYNEYGIKAYVDFDTKGSLIVEMAVPLKEMGITPGSSFNYNIKLNGINIQAMMAGLMQGGGGQGGGTVTFSGGGGDAVRVAPVVVSGGGFNGGGGMPRGMGDMANMFSPTDFWGKYTVVKK